MTNQLHLVFVLIWSLFLSNWITSILGVAAVNPLTRLTVVRIHLLVPFIFVLVALGAFIQQGRVEDVFVAFGFGVLGYYMKKYGWPRISLVIALILGPLVEVNFHLTLKLHQVGRINVWTRPLVLVLFGLMLISLAAPYIPREWMRRSG